MATSTQILAVFDGMTDSAYAEYLPAHTCSMGDVMGYADGALEVRLSDSEAQAVANCIRVYAAWSAAGSMTAHKLHGLRESCACPAVD